MKKHKYNIHSMRYNMLAQKTVENKYEESENDDKSKDSDENNQNTKILKSNYKTHIGEIWHYSGGNLDRNYKCGISFKH